MLMERPRYWWLGQLEENDHNLDWGEQSAMLEGTDCINRSVRPILEVGLNWLVESVS